MPKSNPGITEMRNVADVVRFHLQRLPPAVGLSPDWLVGAPSTRQRRWHEVRHVAFAASLRFDVIGAGQRAEHDLGSLMEAVREAVTKTLFAPGDETRRRLGCNALHLLAAGCDQAALSFVDEEAWREAAESRYLADLCRVPLVDFTTHLLIDAAVGRWPGGERDAARIEWSSAIVAWLRSRTSASAVGAALANALPAVIATHKPFLDQPAIRQTAVGGAAVDALEAIQAWLDSN